MIDLIEKTRDGVALTSDEVRRLVQGFTDGSIPDYQLAAWLMAAYLKGLSDDEVYLLTDVVATSGGPTTSSLGVVDKHSTGGVGDKTTLILAPLVSCLGVPVAKMSGRGLGHTGGTLDKLESIPGYRIYLTKEEIAAQVAHLGIAVVTQTDELAPADKRMYALRDVTATVDSIPLIAISVMSKKLAAGSPNIVLDVKVGNGAFMSSLPRAKELARMMVRIGKHHGRNVRALLTRMDQPLGFAIGNAIEVNEARQCLQGGGPVDLREEVIELASHMVSMGRGITVDVARREVIDALDQGRAWRQFEQWIAGQGGDVSAVVEDLPLAPYRLNLVAERTSVVQSINTYAIGNVALHLGAGRHQLEDTIDPGVGLLCYAKVGQVYERGDVIATAFARSEEMARQAVERLKAAITLVDVRGVRDEREMVVGDRMGQAMGSLRSSESPVLDTIFSADQ